MSRGVGGACRRRPGGQHLNVIIAFILARGSCSEIIAIDTQRGNDDGKCSRVLFLCRSVRVGITFRATNNKILSVANNILLLYRPKSLVEMTLPPSDEDWRVFDILCGQKVNGINDYYYYCYCIITIYVSVPNPSSPSIIWTARLQNGYRGYYIYYCSNAFTGLVVFLFFSRGFSKKIIY